MINTVEPNPSSNRPERPGPDRGHSVQSVQRINGGSSTQASVLKFVQEHPVVAAGGAFVVGAAVVMMVQSRRAQAGRLDRRISRLARNMDRSLSREMRNLRNSEFAERAGRFGSSLGDALSRIDLAPIAERGHAYLEAIASRMRR
jgi:hypothetical protein